MRAGKSRRNPRMIQIGVGGWKLTQETALCLRGPKSKQRLDKKKRMRKEKEGYSNNEVKKEIG